MKRFVQAARVGCVFATALTLARPVAALSQAEFDAAMVVGTRAHTSDEAPAFLLAGRKSPEGSFGRSVFLRTAEAPYLFLIRSCRQWVASETFKAKIDHKPLDLDLLRSQCLDHDAIRIFVAPATRANEIAASTMHYTAIGPQPVTAVAIAIDGQDAVPIEDPDGMRPQTARYAEEPFRSAKEVVLRATIGSSYELTKKVPKRILAEVLGR